MQSPVKIWRNQKKIREHLGREGELLAWTIVRVPPGGFSHLAPYPVVLVSLPGGTRMCAQLVDWHMEDLVVGRKVKTVLRRISEGAGEGVIPYGIKVKPL